MKLSELAAYAEEKYHIPEQHKWTDFPGFSVLQDPRTGKWAALLMRQWNAETGEMTERCDIKCGREAAVFSPRPYLFPPFRMKGANWVGVVFDGETEEDVVFRLLDAALRPGKQTGYLVSLEENAFSGEARYGETLLPDPAALRRERESRERERRERESRERERRERVSREKRGMAGAMDRLGGFPLLQGDFPETGNPDEEKADGGKEREKSGETAAPASLWDVVLPSSGRSRYRETLLPAYGGSPAAGEEIPAPIREMMQLYEPGNGSFRQKCKNFYLQGMFLKDYEDDAPWKGDYRHFYPTYHDFSVRQLRGYFSWRAHVRRGEFYPICSSFAYLYLYELLNGIGCAGPEDSLRKLKEFREGFQEKGLLEEDMRTNLGRWMMEFGVLNQVPPERLRTFLQPETWERDEEVLVLKEAASRTDEEVFLALDSFGKGKPGKSPVVVKEEEKGKHLFAEAFRQMQLQFREGNRDFFTLCFGEMLRRPWYPLANAVYYERKKRTEQEYELNACRRYTCVEGAWKTEGYEPLYFDRKRFAAFLHEADRQFRRYRKTGGTLKGKPEGEVYTPILLAVIQEDQMAEDLAAPPPVTIDFSGLEKIREEALITRDSLLTEEEREELGLGEELVSGEELAQGENLAAEKDLVQREELASQKDLAPGDELVAAEPPAPPAAFPGLSEARLQLLLLLLRGDDPGSYLRERHLMASVEADAVNEALFDEFGDSVLECDGETITLVEDYREDLAALLGES